MRTITVSADLDATPEAVLEALSPRTIIEYEGTYDVEAVDRSDDGWLVTAVAREPALEPEFEFRRRPDGYDYELVGDGPFEALHTTVTVHPRTGSRAASGEPDLATGTTPDDSVRVTMTSEFTFGGWLAALFDRLASSDRRRELERALLALASAVDASGHGTDEDPEDENVGDEDAGGDDAGDDDAGDADPTA